MTKLYANYCYTQLLNKLSWASGSYLLPLWEWWKETVKIRVLVWPGDQNILGEAIFLGWWGDAWRYAHILLLYLNSKRLIPCNLLEGKPTEPPWSFFYISNIDGFLRTSSYVNWTRPNTFGIIQDAKIPSFWITYISSIRTSTIWNWESKEIQNLTGWRREWRKWTIQILWKCSM